MARLYALAKRRALWQGFKPVNNCGILVKDRGKLILLIAAPEDVSPDHQELAELATTPGEQAMAMVKRGEVSDKVAAATYMAFDRTRSEVGIILVTDNISPAEAGRIGTGSKPHFTEALKRSLARLGRTG